MKKHNLNCTYKAELCKTRYYPNKFLVLPTYVYVCYILNRHNQRTNT